jgi:hypothetical protein
MHINPMQSLENLFKVIEDQHFPVPPLPNSDFKSINNALDVVFPLEIRYFYKRMNGARFFKKIDSPFRMLGLHEISRVGQLLFDDASVRIDGLDLFGLVFHNDDSYFAGDFSGAMTHCMPIVDCYAGTFGKQNQSAIISMSFAEMLHRILQSEGESFQLRKTFLNYAYV